MKYLADRSLEDAPLVLVKQMNGCNIYVPKAYNTPLSYLKPGCPIWIQVGVHSTCKVYELEGNGTLAETQIRDMVDALCDR